MKFFKQLKWFSSITLLCALPAWSQTLSTASEQLRKDATSVKSSNLFFLSKQLANKNLSLEEVGETLARLKEVTKNAINDSLQSNNPILTRINQLDSIKQDGIRKSYASISPKTIEGLIKSESYKGDRNLLKKLMINLSYIDALHSTEVKSKINLLPVNTYNYSRLELLKPIELDTHKLSAEDINILLVPLRNVNYLSGKFKELKGTTSLAENMQLFFTTQYYLKELEALLCHFQNEILTLKATDGETDIFRNLNKQLNVKLGVVTTLQNQYVDSNKRIVKDFQTQFQSALNFTKVDNFKIDIDQLFPANGVNLEYRTALKNEFYAALQKDYSIHQIESYLSDQNTTILNDLIQVDSRIQGSLALPTSVINVVNEKANTSPLKTVMVQSVLQHSESYSSGFKLPSETDVLNAMAMFLANRAKQETLTWFIDQLKDEMHNPLIFDAFPNTYQMLKNTANIQSPSFGTSWRMSLSKDFVTLPVNLINSRYIEKFLQGGQAAELKEMFTIGHELLRMVNAQYNYTDIVKYFQTIKPVKKFVPKDSPLVDEGGNLWTALDVLYVVNNELFNVDVVDEKMQFRLLSFEEINSLTPDEWHYFLDLVSLKYGPKIAAFVANIQPEDSKLTALKKHEADLHTVKIELNETVKELRVMRNDFCDSYIKDKNKNKNKNTVSDYKEALDAFNNLDSLTPTDGISIKKAFLDKKRASLKSEVDKIGLAVAKIRNENPLFKKEEQELISLQMMEKSKKWLSSLLLTISQIDRSNYRNLSEAVDADDVTVWKNLIAVISHLDPSSNTVLAALPTDVKSLSKPYLDNFKNVLSVYENIHHKKFDKATTSIFNLIQENSNIIKFDLNYNAIEKEFALRYKDSLPISKFKLPKNDVVAIRDMAYDSRLKSIKFDYTLHPINQEIKNESISFTIEEIKRALHPLNYMRDKISKEDLQDISKSLQTIDMNYDFKDVSSKGFLKFLNSFLGDTKSDVDKNLLHLSEFAKTQHTDQLVFYQNMSLLVDLLSNPKNIINNNMYRNYDLTSIISKFSGEFKYGKQLLKTTALFTDILNTTDSKSLYNVIEKHAAPPTSYITKRKIDHTWALNGYVGVYGGAQGLLTKYSNYKAGAMYGLTAPIGITYSRKKNGLFLQLIDLGNLVGHYLWATSDDTESKEVHFKEVISPGFNYMRYIPKSPFAVFAGASFVPLKTEITSNNVKINDSALDLWQFKVGIKIDIPIVNLYAKQKD